MELGGLTLGRRARGRCCDGPLRGGPGALAHPREAVAGEAEEEGARRPSDGDGAHGATGHRHRRDPAGLLRDARETRARRCTTLFQREAPGRLLAACLILQEALCGLVRAARLRGIGARGQKSGHAEQPASSSTTSGALLGRRGAGLALEQRRGLEVVVADNHSARHGHALHVAQALRWDSPRPARDQAASAQELHITESKRTAKAKACRVQVVGENLSIPRVADGSLAIARSTENRR
mmetsp:Transcript_97909/g.282459  ORF Transcript_97909/g.282459 Transcript_97909/m.282459 type:complete len:238 (+) Transcript_97909:831-1544(+)